MFQLDIYIYIFRVHVQEILSKVIPEKVITITKIGLQQLYMKMFMLLNCMKLS